MKGIPTQVIAAVAYTLISALAIAQAPDTSSPQTAPSAQTAATPQTTAQPGPPSGQSPGNAPAGQTPAAPPSQTTAEPSQTPPATMTAQPGQMQPVQGQSLSAPSLQSAPLPQGCTQRGDKDRVRMKASCGVLVDADGKPLPNVSLQLVESGQQNAYLFIFSRAISDKEGKFDFGPVPSGHYLLRTAEGAPATVYNFVATDTVNADAQCSKPVEVKAAAAGQCNSEVRSSGKGGFSLTNVLRRKGAPKGDKATQ
jgi:hypothetical protein